MRFRIYVDLERLSGPERDEETVLDALCANLGEQNGATPPFKFVIGDQEFDDAPVTIYRIKLADDRP